MKCSMSKAIFLGSCVGGIMTITRVALLLIVGALLGGCGLYVPEIQDFGDRVTGQQLVESIAYNVTCEVRDAVYSVYHPGGVERRSTFMDSWGVQIALSLQVEEKASLNPVVNWLPPSPASSIFNLAGAGTLSSDATRQDKLNSFYAIAAIRDMGPCDPKTRPGGLLLMQSNLALDEWLIANVTADDTGLIQYAKDYSDGPLKTNVLSHEVKFDITNSGNLTPGWKLTRVSINQSGNFLSATRDRTNDLTITLGPTLATPKIKKDKNGRLVATAARSYVPAQPAADAALASAIGLAVANAIKSTTVP
jgi:hypothetical protein